METEKYTYSKERNEKIRQKALGRKNPKLSALFKQRYASGEMIPPKGMLGKTNKWGHHTEETKRKIREKLIGNRLSEETKEKLRKAHQGKNPWNYFKDPEKTKKKLSDSHKGQKAWNKGKTREDIQQFIELNTNKHLCKCGCGNFISIQKFHKYNGIPQFLPFHNTSGKFKKGQKSWRYGLTNTEILRHYKHGFPKPMLGKKNPNAPFKKGHVPWNKGLTIEDPKIKEYTEKRKKTITQLFREGKLEPWNKRTKGLCKPNTGSFSKDMAPWNKGKHYTEEQYNKIFTEERNKKLSERMCLENNPSWLGGVSFEPYTIDFNQRFKEAIRERDNYCCIECNTPQEELGYKLHIHHIDYNKLNSFKENTVSLCRPCHTKTNLNRKHWTTFFQSLLSERYGYNYTEDQKIILDFTNNQQGVE